MESIKLKKIIGLETIGSACLRPESVKNLRIQSVNRPLSIHLHFMLYTFTPICTCPEHKYTLYMRILKTFVQSIALFVFYTNICGLILCR